MCKGCREEFDYDVGEVTFIVGEQRPRFERELRCRRCGKRSLDDIELTEVGQSQLTLIYLEKAGM